MTIRPADGPAPARAAPPPSGRSAGTAANFLIILAAASPVLIVYLFWFTSRFYEVATSDEKGWSVITLPISLALCAAIWASVAVPAALALSLPSWPLRIALLAIAAALAMTVGGWIGASAGPGPAYESRRINSGMLFGQHFWRLVSATWLICVTAWAVRQMAIGSRAAAGEAR